MLSDETRIVFPSGGLVTLPLCHDPLLVCCQAAGPGGRPLTVLLDTGADPSAIDLGLARRLGLRLGEFGLGQGAATDALPFTETVVPWLNLGGLGLRQLFAVAIDLAGLPVPLDLVLGYNVLSQLVTRIDYQRGLVELRHPDLGSAPLDPGAALLPLSFFEHFPALRDVHAGPDVVLPLVTIDTGSNGALTIGADLAARLALSQGAPGVSAREGIGFGGAQQVLARTIAQLQVGPFVLHDVEVDTPLGASGDLVRPGRANLGNAVLRRLASLTLDYQRAICMLGPLPEAYG